MLLGTLITQKRWRLGLSLRDLAERMTLAGYDPQTPHLWPHESKYKNRCLPLAHARFCSTLASALEIDLEELMQLTEDEMSILSLSTEPSRL